MSNLTSKRKSSVKSKGFYMLGFSMILTIAFVHFAAQIFFIRTENSRLVETAAEIAPPVELIADHKATEDETPKTEVAKISEVGKPDVRRQPKISRQAESVPARVPSRKKVAVESKAERLRRVERILTGI